jgi:flagellar motility protein MotE (MotC chaperone)
LKSVRLLPVVIFAALALLLFKGIGLVTNGGYVLSGTDAVLAAGGSGGTAETVAESGIPGEVTLTDSSPTLDDTAPTLATKPEASSAHGDSSEAAHESSESATPAESSTSSEMSSSEVSQAEAELACPPTAEAGHGETPAVECPPAVTGPVNEHGDALPLVKDADGNIVPLTAEGDASEEALVARLSERRAELDKREADLTMRLALLEAAEKRLDERTQELAALEARVAALVDEKQAAEEEGFKAVVSMYEGMKPKDAAKIFDTLSMNVLLKVARAMSPRKMSPILAAMSPDPAQKLTTAMAATENTDVVTETGENLAQLPQIVGQ